MWQQVCLHSLLWCLIVVIVAEHVGAQDASLREGTIIHEARQVECAHPAKNLGLLTLEELGNTTRTVVVNRADKTCSGNVTFHSCVVDGAVVKIVAMVTDLEEGEVRRLTCKAAIFESSRVVHKDLGEVNVTETGRTTNAGTAGSTPGVTKAQGDAETGECDDASSAKLVIGVLIVVLVLLGVVNIVLVFVYVRARRSVTHPLLETDSVKGHKVRSDNEYQSSYCSAPLSPTLLYPAPTLQARDVPGRGLVAQYQRPVFLLADGSLVPAEAGGDAPGLQQYQQPWGQWGQWGQLDTEIASRVATLRPNRAMCHVPGFEKPELVTDKSLGDRADNE